MSQSRVRQTRAARRSSACPTRRYSRGLARELCRDAASRPTTLQLEAWVSWLFGQLWECRDNVPESHPEGFELALGRQIVEDFAAIGGPNGHLALSAIARLDRGELGAHAYLLASQLGHRELPAHVHDVGRAKVVRAAITDDDDGSGSQGVLLEAEVDGGGAHTVAAFMDEELGGLATSLYLLHDLDTIREIEHRNGRQLDGWEDLAFSETAPSSACRLVREAILQTDLLLWPPVHEHYARVRALAFARACSVA